MQLSVSTTFDAAHRLLGYEGKCANLHGHTYHVSMMIASISVVRDASDPLDTMVLDFGVAKKILKEAVEPFDHATIIWEHDTDLVLAASSLNTKYIICPNQTTTENLMYIIRENIRKELNLHAPDDIVITELRVSETPGNSIIA